MNSFDIDSPVLKSLNKDERAFLDSKDSEIRKEIAWYLDKIEHYRAIPLIYLGLEYERITKEQAKFQYTFWFEAMVWYIRAHVKMIEAKKESK